MVLPTHLPTRLPKVARLELAEDLNVPADVTPAEDGLGKRPDSGGGLRNEGGNGNYEDKWKMLPSGDLT